VVTAYLLTSTASTPLYGKLGDLYGRKTLFQASIVIFLLGSVLSGLAGNMTQLIGFRAVQGLGAGGLMSLAMAIVGDIVPPRQRGRYQGYFGAVFAFSSVIGPLVGGLFVGHLSWRWVFYVNLPLGALALVVTSTVLRLPVVRRPHKIDYLGSALLVGAVSTALLVTVWGGTEYAWGSGTIRTLVAVAVVLLVLFVLQERRAAEPVLPLRLFRERVFSVAGAASFIVGMAMFGAIIFVPLYLQVVNGVSPTRAGLLLTPLMGGIIVASVGSGRIISRWGRYKVFPVAGAAVLTAGLYLLSRFDVDTSRLVQSLSMIVIGLGVGLIMQNLVLAVQNAAAPEDLGTATSAASFFRSMGGSFGVAVFGAIFNSQLSSRLAALVPGGGAIDVDSLRAGPEALQSLPPVLRDRVVDAFASALHVTFMWGIPIAALGLVVVLFLEERPLRDTAHAAPADSLADELAA
jgi:EmrB/QacA subfamily drug resistance transporter